MLWIFRQKSFPVFCDVPGGNKDSSIVDTMAFTFLNPVAPDSVFCITNVTVRTRPGLLMPTNTIRKRPRLFNEGNILLLLNDTRQLLGPRTGLCVKLFQKKLRRYFHFFFTNLQDLDRILKKV